MSAPQKLTDNQRIVLQRVAWGTRHFGALLTGRLSPLRVVLALKVKGLVCEAGLVLACDGDGYTVQPERYRHGWKTTTRGTAIANARSP